MTTDLGPDMQDGSVHDVRTPHHRLLEMQLEHADLDAQIDALLHAGLGHDQLAVQRMKKRRLQLRDQMAQLERMLDPGEPA